LSRAPRAGEDAEPAPSEPLLAEDSSPLVAAGARSPADSDRLAALEQWLSGDAGWTLAVAGVTLLGGLLRLAALRRVALNPFYDAAVRSMGLSWHNLFFGAFDPTGSASIDKPPLDLWLQVLSVKVLGYEPLALKAPAVLAAVAAVILLYDLVRRYAGRAAGLCSAFALAVMPVSVLTSRSDTMDSLMMGLLVLCAWLIARACERRSLGLLLLGGVALGLAFNTKLLEALVALPALAAAAWLGGWGSRRARVGRVALAGAVFVACALSWMTIVSLTPRQDRPYPIGSTNGSVWNAVFVFNGTDRLLKAPQPDRFGAPQGAVLLSAATRPESLVASVAAAAPPRRHRRGSKSPAGPLRLFAPTTLDYGGLIGVPLLGAILLGAGALAVVRPRLRASERGGLEGRGAAIVALGVWLATGLVLFSFTSRLHQRYLEAFTPAVAATLGVGLVVLGARVHSVRALAVLLGALVLSALEVVIVVGTGSIELLGEAGAVALTLVVVAGALIALALRRRSGTWAWWWLPGLVTLGAAAAVFAFPVARDVRLIRDHSSDEAASPLFPPRTTARLSAFLLAHQGGARYEFAAASPSIAAPVLTRDVRPIRLLTTNQARPLTTLALLQSDIAAGQVRFVLTRGRCPATVNHLLTACSPTLDWVRAHGRDVTARLGLTQRSGLLYAFGPV